MSDPVADTEVEETFEFVEDEETAGGSTTDYTKFIHDIWIYKLMAEFDKINEVISANTGKRLTYPTFAITPDMGRWWGMWHPTERMLRLNEKLFKNFEWGAVQRVLRHEMGHMVVSEIFKFNPEGCCHGEHWKIAMAAVGEENPRRCDSIDFLGGLKGTELSPMADRVRKLMAKGSDTNLSKEEAELFMEKAQALMSRHQLTMKDIMGTDKVWVKRPVGMYFKRWPNWMGTLGVVVGEIYNVRSIRTYAYINGVGLRYYLELFGEPDNLDIAEYVFHAVLNNGKVLFAEALREHNERCATDPNYLSQNQRWSYNGGGMRRKKFTEASFMLGLVMEWRDKMMRNKRKLDEELGREDASYSIVATANSKLLGEMYGEAYPNVRQLGGYSNYGAGRSAGRAAGAGLNIGTGIRGSGRLALKG